MLQNASQSGSPFLLASCNQNDDVLTFKHLLNRSLSTGRFTQRLYKISLSLVTSYRNTYLLKPSRKSAVAS